MESEKIYIKTIEGPITASTGKLYWKIEDNVGKICSCFEQAIVDQLEPGKEYDVTIVENAKGFRNLRQLNSVPTEGEPVKASEKPVGASQSKEKLASILTSYVKDLIIADKDWDKQTQLSTASKVIMEAYKSILKELE